MSNLKEDLKPYLKGNETTDIIAYKSGFLACIKAIEHRGFNDLKLDLEMILLKL